MSVMVLYPLLWSIKPIFYDLCYMIITLARFWSTLIRPIVELDQSFIVQRHPLNLMTHCVKNVDKRNIEVVDSLELPQRCTKTSI